MSLATALFHIVLCNSFILHCPLQQLYSTLSLATALFYTVSLATALFYTVSLATALFYTVFFATALFHCTTTWSCEEFQTVFLKLVLLEENSNLVFLNQQQQQLYSVGDAVSLQWKAWVNHYRLNLGLRSTLTHASYCVAWGHLDLMQWSSLFHLSSSFTSWNCYKNRETESVRTKQRASELNRKRQN